MATKERRVEVQRKLESVTPNVYFQPPANVSMNYPCIVYHKAPPKDIYANDQRYGSRQKYTITVMDRNPDTQIAEQIVEIFSLWSSGQREAGRRRRLGEVAGPLQACRGYRSVDAVSRGGSGARPD